MASNARLVQRARDWKVDIRGKLNSVLITEARPLFDPMTAVHYDTLEQLSDEIEHPLDALDAVGAFEDVELMLDRRSAVVTVMEDIRAHLKMFADDLAELGQTFL
ncbi:hypothetical protein FJW04_23250 [Mesorhizobium sp. B2-7-3]|nr:hypothetical protein [Mesorhizobium sp. B2-7-3]TPJ12172.1 hypothetical protein FJW04_23250 [Mesorhizobium sp. B2-7-3]